MNLKSDFIYYKQFNERRVMYPDVKIGTIIYLEENIGKYVYNLRVGQHYLGHKKH